MAVEHANKDDDAELAKMVAALGCDQSTFVSAEEGDPAAQLIAAEYWFVLVIMGRVSITDGFAHALRYGRAAASSGTIINVTKWAGMLLYVVSALDGVPQLAEWQAEEMGVEALAMIGAAAAAGDGPAIATLDASKRSLPRYVADMAQQRQAGIRIVPDPLPRAGDTPAIRHAMMTMRDQFQETIH